MLTIDIEIKGKIILFIMQGEITPGTTKDFDRAMYKYLSEDYSVIGIDMKKIPYIDSYAISRLIKLSRIVKEKGGELVLMNMNDNIYQIFRMANFDRFFTIISGEEFVRTYLRTENLEVRPAAENQKRGLNAADTAVKRKTVQYIHNDISGTTLLFEEEEQPDSES